MARRFAQILALALAGAVVPAWAEFSFQTSQSQFLNALGGLTPTALTSFSNLDLLSVDSVSNDEYFDPMTGIEFWAFNSTGQLHVPFASSSGSATLKTAGGGLIEVVLPSNTQAFAANFTTTGFNNLCFEPGASSFNSSCAEPAANPFMQPSQTVFVGTVSDSLPSEFTTVWIGPIGGSPDTQILNYELGFADIEVTPEPATLLLMAAGLALLWLIRDRGIA